MIGSDDGAAVAAGAAGFLVALGFGVTLALAAFVGVVGCSVLVAPTVGSGVILGASDVAVGGGSVAVTMTVIACDA